MIVVTYITPIDTKEAEGTIAMQNRTTLRHPGDSTEPTRKLLAQGGRELSDAHDRELGVKSLSFAAVLGPFRARNHGAWCLYPHSQYLLRSLAWAHRVRL